MSTEGLEVLVQEVMAAMTTLPCWRESLTDSGTCSRTFGSWTPTAAGLPPSCSQRFFVVGATAGMAPALVEAFGFIRQGRASQKDSPAWESTTLSCGRFGPASEGYTVAMSR